MNLTSELPSRNYDEVERKRRFEYLSLTDRDEELLRDVWALVQPRLDEIVDAFYAHLTAFEATRKAFQSQAQIERLKQAQKHYLMQALSGAHDEEYFRSRWRLGYVHNSIHVEPRWFIGAFQLYRRLLYPRIVEGYRDDAGSMLEHLLALDKIMTLDMELGLESYWAHYSVTMDQLRTLNEQIREASAAKSEFLANMSHEFRTPLNAILGFAEVLQDQGVGSLNPEQIEYLEDIHKAGQDLLRLVSDVLDLAKVEAGHLELIQEEFQVAQAIREAVATVRGSAEKKRLSIRTELPSDLGTMIADELRFKQILYNLLGNAIKFTERGGITVAAAREGNQLHLRVADTGLGIAPEECTRIFEAFSQLGSGEARLQGAGLGLSVSRRLVEAHGGKIWVESDVGTGSTFHVVFPLCPSSVDAGDQGTPGVSDDSSGPAT